MISQEKKLQLADMLVDIVQDILNVPPCVNNNTQGGQSLDAPLPSLGHQSNVPVSQVAPPTDEEIFLFQKSIQIVTALNASVGSNNSSEEFSAFMLLFSLLLDTSTYVQFCYVWEKLTLEARKLFIIGYMSMESKPELSVLMKKYLGL
jgi:hypothetical protein